MLSSEQRVALKQRVADDCALIMLPNPKGWNDRHKTPEQKQEIVDRAQTLQAGIRMTYEQKVAHAQLVIRRALGIDATGELLDPDMAAINWAVSYSAGGDSTVLSHLMTVGMGLKIQHVGSNTRMEYPETVKQWREWAVFLESHEVKFSMVFPTVKPRELWKKIGVPIWSKQIGKKFGDYSRSSTDTIPRSVPDNLREAFRRLKSAGLKVTHKCCDELKKKPLAKWDKENGITGHFTGMRCSESRARRLMWIQVGALYNSVSHRQWICNPLSFWTGEDIARYKEENRVSFHRPNTIRGGSGCVACMFGCHLTGPGEPNALQQLAVSNPKMHVEALDEWGYREVLDLLEIPYV